MFSLRKKFIILHMDKFCRCWDEVVPRPKYLNRFKPVIIYRTRYNLVRTQNLTVNGIISRAKGKK